MATPSKRRLGRGLDGLLPAAPAANARPSSNARIEQLEPNRDQPRSHFDEEALAELTASIAEHGVLEPILVRKRGSGRYEIIAGERRWRAAQRAGLKEVPIFVRDLSDEASFEAALVENLQREDLNPVETARAFRRLVDEFGHSQETIAQRVGKNRATVANSLRLLKLPEDVLDLVESGELSEGHGRALLTASSVTDMKRLGRAAVGKGWSVRETERQARSSQPKSNAKASGGKGSTKSANVRDLERRLANALGSNVEVAQSRGGRGKLVISYSSLEELDRVIAHILDR